MRSQAEAMDGYNERMTWAKVHIDGRGMGEAHGEMQRIAVEAVRDLRHRDQGVPWRHVVDRGPGRRMDGRIHHLHDSRQSRPRAFLT